MPPEAGLQGSPATGAVGLVRGRGRLLVLGCGALLLTVVAVLVLLQRARTGLTLFEFGDETEKFVAAQLMDRGQRLYRDIFAHHGPVPYLIAHLYTVLVSAHDFTAIRVVMVVLAGAAGAALWCSSALRGGVPRLWALAVFLGLLAALWLMQGLHMVMYQPLGGWLLAIAALLWFGPLYFGRCPGRGASLVSGAAVATACFSAYAFGPSAALLTAASALLLATVQQDGPVGRRVLAPFAAGVLLASAAIVVWLLLFADLKGYLVYHFYFNQRIYSSFIDFSLRRVIDIFNFAWQPPSVIHAFVLFLTGCWTVLLALWAMLEQPRKNVPRKWAALLLLIGAALFLNPRGVAGFHDSGFVVFNLTLFAWSCGLLLQRSLQQPGVVGALGVALLCLATLGVAELLVARHAVSTPHGVAWKALKSQADPMRPRHDAPYEAIRDLVPDDGRVLALIINPAFYIKTDRLPASGHYYYLPWQAAYGRDPVPGYHLDICADIKENAPAVIWFDDWRVWEKYSIKDYEPCVPALIQERYSRSAAHTSVWVRKDLPPLQ